MSDLGMTTGGRRIITLHGDKEDPDLSYETVPEFLQMYAIKRGLTVAIRDLESRSEITYAALWGRVCALAGALGQQELSVDRPIAILSGNSINHAVVSFAGMVLGVPVAPISVAYSQFSDSSRIRELFAQLTPGLVFAEDGEEFARGLAIARESGIPTLVAQGEGGEDLLSDLEKMANPVTPSDAINGDTIAKILFTSGSTGTPKGVIVTHRMICSNQEAMANAWPFLKSEPPVIVDWLPWNHVYGGNLVTYCALRNAGTLIIDDGRPTTGLFDRTVTNLATYQPTIHFGVPRGFDLLVQALGNDENAARSYFSRLRRMFTAGAALSATTWDRYRALAKTYANPDFAAHVGWGATETSPVVTMTPAGNTRADNLGVPVQGCTVKMVPDQDKLELRLSGPMITPGYWRNPAATAEAFDEEGFYCIGDAGRLCDNDPDKGILFDGRISENFKLVTGTWVQVNALRLETVEALRPAVQDVVVAGHDRDAVGVLMFMDVEGCRSIAGLPKASLSDLIGNEALRAHLASGLAKIGRGGGSSGRVARAAILLDAPSQEDGEMTDKGYLNQRAALRKRDDVVTRLFNDDTHPSVVIADA